MPRSLLRSCLLVGVGISLIPCTLSGSGLRPSWHITCPINFTSLRRSLSFSLFNLMPVARQRSNNAVSFASWSESASVSVSPTPKTRISSNIGLIPSRPSRAYSNLLWNSSGAGDMPKGIRVQRNLPQGVPNVVRRLLSSSSCTCQKPFFASTTLKTLAFVRSGSRSSITGRGKWFLLSALFRGFGSIHNLIFPLLFLMTTIEEIQSVGTSTGCKMPILTKRSSSCFKGSFTAKGTFLTGSATGVTDLSISRWSFPLSFPSPEKTSPNLLTRSGCVGISFERDMMLSVLITMRPNCCTDSAPRSAVWPVGTTVYSVRKHCPFLGLKVSTLVHPRGFSSDLLNMTRVVWVGWRRSIRGSLNTCW